MTAITTIARKIAHHAGEFNADYKLAYDAGGEHVDTKIGQSAHWPLVDGVRHYVITGGTSSPRSVQDAMDAQDQYRADNAEAGTRGYIG